jgi:hypothetical protein
MAGSADESEEDDDGEDDDDENLEHLEDSEEDWAARDGLMPAGWVPEHGIRSGTQSAGNTDGVLSDDGRLHTVRQATGMHRRGKRGAVFLAGKAGVKARARAKARARTKAGARAGAGESRGRTARVRMRGDQKLVRNSQFVAQDSRGGVGEFGVLTTHHTADELRYEHGHSLGSQEEANCGDGDVVGSKSVRWAGERNKALRVQSKEGERELQRRMVTVVRGQDFTRTEGAYEGGAVGGGIAAADDGTDDGSEAVVVQQLSSVYERVGAQTVWADWTCQLGFPVMGIWPHPGADGAIGVTSVAGHVIACHLSDCGGFLVTGDRDGLVKLFHFPSVVEHAPYRAYAGHASRVQGVDFADRDRYVVSSGGRDGTTLQWRIRRIGLHRKDKDKRNKGGRT